MIDKAATVEDDGLDALGLGTFGDQLTDGSRRGAVACAASTLEISLEGRCRGQSLAKLVVNDLRIDMLLRAMHGQPDLTRRYALQGGAVARPAALATLVP